MDRRATAALQRVALALLSPLFFFDRPRDKTRFVARGNLFSLSGCCILVLPSLPIPNLDKDLSADCPGHEPINRSALGSISSLILYL
jgi:hypothetical protein